MKKIIFLLAISFMCIESAYAGVFSKSLIEKKEVEGKIIAISSDTDFGEDYFIFSDMDWSNFLNQPTYYNNMKKRMSLVFNEINSFGKKRGYKSFIFVNTKISFYEGFPISDEEQLIDYCMLQGKGDKKQFKSFCAGDNDTLLSKDSDAIKAKVVFFKESQPNYFQIK